MHSIRYSICYCIEYIQGMQGLSYIRVFYKVFYRVFQMYSKMCIWELQWVLNTVFYKYFIRHSMNILYDIQQGIP